MKTIPQRYRAKVPINTLTPHPLNPRQGDVGAISESIEENGWYGAVVVQKSTQHILAGNHRTIAAAQADGTSVPVLELDCDDETALNILLADNRSNDKATYNDPMLTDILQVLARERARGLAGTGYDGDDLDDLVAKAQELGFPNADGNVGRLPTIDEKLTKYENSNVRGVVLEYPLVQFRWLVDALAGLREQYGMESNGDVVLRLVEAATDTKAPKHAA